MAEGAALAAAAMTGESDVVFDVISNHALGTRVMDQEGKQFFSEVIPRGVSLPYSASKRFMPNRDGVVQTTVQVWEGDPNLPLDNDENVKLAELLLRTDKPRPREESEFELEYSYDLDGILHVTARHLKSGQTLLSDAVDFFSDGVGDIDPEVRDVKATFAPPDEVAPVVQAKPVQAVVREHRGPVLVVDGSNLACVNRNVRAGGDKPSYGQLRGALDALTKVYPGADIKVVVDANLRYRIDASERPDLDADIAAGRVIVPPAGTVGAGDAIVLGVARRKAAIVVSNDSYREFQVDHPWLRESGRVLGATLIEEDWYFNPRTPPRPQEAARPAPSGIGVREASRDRAGGPDDAALPEGWDRTGWSTRSEPPRG